MKDRKLRKYIYYVLLTGLSAAAACAVLFIFFGGVWGKISLITLLCLPPARLVTEIYGFSESGNYRFALISAVLLFLIFLEFVL